MSNHNLDNRCFVSIEAVQSLRKLAEDILIFPIDLIHFSTLYVEHILIEAVRCIMPAGIQESIRLAMRLNIISKVETSIVHFYDSLSAKSLLGHNRDIRNEQCPVFFVDMIKSFLEKVNEVVGVVPHNVLLKIEFP
jgi:hypothetical protein